MEEFVVFLKVLIAICAGGCTLFGFYYYVKKLIAEQKAPDKELAEKVEKLKEENEENKRKLEALENELKNYVDDKFISNDKMMSKLNEDVRVMKEKLDGTQEEIRLILTSQLAIGNHLITNGSKEAIQKANDSIVDHLINKG